MQGLRGCHPEPDEGKGYRRPQLWFKKWSPYHATHWLEDGNCTEPDPSVTARRF